MVTIQKLAEALHAAYQSADQHERWHKAAIEAIATLNGRPKVSAILAIGPDGEIVDLPPPTTVSTDSDPESTPEPTPEG